MLLNKKTAAKSLYSQQRESEVFNRKKMTEEIKEQQQNKEDEIDLIALTKTLWQARRFILITVLIFMCIGIIVAFLKPKEYTATATVVPQSSSNTSKLGGLSSLAAMAGFNLSNVSSSGSNDLSPMIYPQIVSSVPFQLEIMNTSFKFPDIDHPVSFYSYYTDIKKPGALGLVAKYTVGLPFVILKAIKGEPKPINTTGIEENNIISLTKDQEKIRQQLDRAIMLEVNSKEGYLTLSATAMDAVLAAQMAQKALTLLQQNITSLKIEKASGQLKFIEERFNENKKEFDAARNALAAFKDKNKNVTSARAQIRKQELQNDYQLAYDVYSELAKQLEQARIQVKEDTPVLSVIKPVTVPSKDSGRSGMMTLITWIFLGGIVSIGWIFGKQFMATIKERWNEKENNKG